MAKNGLLNDSICIYAREGGNRHGKRSGEYKAVLTSKDCLKAVMMSPEENKIEHSTDEVHRHAAARPTRNK